mgnify:CR=1 FL=1
MGSPSTRMAQNRRVPLHCEEILGHKREATKRAIAIAIARALHRDGRRHKAVEWVEARRSDSLPPVS